MTRHVPPQHEANAQKLCANVAMGRVAVVPCNIEGMLRGRRLLLWMASTFGCCICPDAV